MKGMPLTFDFEGKGEFQFGLVGKDNVFPDCASISSCWGKDFLKTSCFLNSFEEPTPVLDSAWISRRPPSSSTLSTSLGGTSTDTAGVAAVSEANPSPKLHQDSTIAASSNAGTDTLLFTLPAALGVDKCTMADWESAISQSLAVSPCQEQSILRWIMGDVEDSGIGGLHKVLQINSDHPPPDAEFGSVLGLVDQAFGGDFVGQIGSNLMSANPTSVICSSLPNRFNAEKFGALASYPPVNLASFPSSDGMMQALVSKSHGAIAFNQCAQSGVFDSTEMKATIFNPGLINHRQTQLQNSSFLSHQQENHFSSMPEAKRHISNGTTGATSLQFGGLTPKVPFLDTGQDPFAGRRPVNNQDQEHSQFQFLPPSQQGRPLFGMGLGTLPKVAVTELGHCDQQQQAIIDQLFKAVELVQTGNSVLAQGILARLNHQFLTMGKPFQRAAFHFKEALLFVISSNNNFNLSAANELPFSLIFKFGAYKSFSEISPVMHFTNFTCNQGILEVSEGFDMIQIVDFDIGYGGQWASLMQELALRSGSVPILKIMALASPSTHNQLELSLTRENLISFANEINMSFEFEVMSIDSLNSGSWSLPFHVSENETVVVNLPVNTFASTNLSIPAVLCFVKHLSPKIIVSVDRGCDRTDLSLANHLIHALQSYTNLLESLDTANVNMDVRLKIERFLLQPGIQQIVTSRFRYPEKTQHWRSLFLSSGFSPITFSSFTESQAECLVKRTPQHGFQVEKRQSSLVLCWQRKELVSVSAWRC